LALIVPSIWHDVFPLVILEAFREQTPVLLRNIGGLPEIIQDSRGGLVYNTEDDLLPAMEQLLVKSRRNELGRSGHRAFQQKWTVDAHLNNYFNLIREIAAVSGKPRENQL